MSPSASLPRGVAFIALHLLLISVIWTVPAFAQVGCSWSPLGLGTNGPVTAMAVFDDGGGAGPVLFVGGIFTTAGGQSTNNIAKWSGSNWSALGSGVDSLGVTALTAFDDGTGPALYVGGEFTMAGGLPANNIARWDGSSWSGLLPYALSATSGTNSQSDRVYTLTVLDDGTGPALLAGGYFTIAGGAAVNGIAKWPCGSTISLSSTQPGGPGSPVHVNNTNLMPGSEYYNTFSMDVCAGGPGTGPHLGMCLATNPNYTFILDQLQAPLGTPLFHFIAQDSYTIWGGYQIPPMTVDGIVFDFTGGVIGPVSPVTRITIL